MATKKEKTELPEAEFPKSETFSTPAKELDLEKPEDFLQSKGHQSYHEGQKMNVTFEEMAELLKEYRNL